MNWRDIIKETGIEVIWTENDYSQEGSYIPPCWAYPNGAISLRENVPEYRLEFVALHEVGHLVSGRNLEYVHERLKNLEHCKNEANANRYLFQNVAQSFVSECGENREYATPQRLCAYLGIKSTFENINIAQQEIDLAFWGDYD